MAKTSHPSAGAAFLQALESRGELADVTARWSAYIKAFSREWATIEPLLRASLADFENRYGVPYPTSPEEWVELLVRAGMSPDTVLKGDYPAELTVPIVEGYLQRLQDQQRPAADADKPSPAAQAAPDDPPKQQDDSAWVPAATLWPGRFEKYKELGKFRKRHPEMFRNPSDYKLEIHSGLWTRYWDTQDKAGFDALDNEPASIADDPEVSEEFLAEAAQRMVTIRSQKQLGKR